jgi:hypothetical protein
VFFGTAPRRRQHVLAEGFGREAGEFVICDGKADLDWFAAYLAVFNVGLAADGQVQHHRNFFSTIWTGEFVFHSRTRYCNRSGRTTGAASTGEALLLRLTKGPALTAEVLKRLVHTNMAVWNDIF